MKKLWIGIILLVLTLAIAGMATAETQITPNTQTTVNITTPDDAAVFEFTPTADGMYRFYSMPVDEHNWWDTYGYLLDDARQVIAENDDVGQYLQFEIIRLLKANHKYYFAAAMLESSTTGSFAIRLDRIDGLYATAENEKVYVGLNQPGTLSVKAYSPNGGLTYQWYDGTTAIAGATGSKYQFPALSQRKTYKCVVKDSANQTQEVLFEAMISTGVSCRSNDAEVAYGGTATLTVTATATYGADSLTYQWFEEERVDNNNWRTEALEGETSPTLTLTNVTKNRQVYCEVTDINGDSNNCWCYVEVTGEGTAISALSGGGKEEEEITVQVGSNVPMTVTAETGASYQPITYRWSKVAYMENGEDWKAIPGATGTGYTLVNAVLSGTYVCEAINSLGNSDYVYFYVNVTGEFSVSADGDDLIEMSPGETKTLKVKAENCQSPSYQWLYYEQAFYRYVTIQGANSASYTLSGNVRKGWYACRVTDVNGTGGQKCAYFNVYVDNSISLVADSPTRLSLNPGETATLKVKETSGAADISYRWYWGEGGYGPGYRGEMIEDEQTDSLTITGSVRGTYLCRAFDPYGNSWSVSFSVYVENGFSVTAGQTTYAVGPEESVTLSVTGNCNSGGITYRWTRYASSYGPGSSTVVKETGESFLELGTINSSNYGRYELYAYDEYGNSTNINFQVSVLNHLSVRVVGNTEIAANPGESVRLEVSASCDRGEITYRWSHDYTNHPGSEIIKESNEHFLVIDPVNSESIGRYQLYVYDEYGNEFWINFYISIQNHLTASAVGDPEITVDPGDNATLKVTASCDSGTPAYQWYEEKRDDRGWYYSNISNETQDTLQLTNIQQAKRYYCNVSDEYGGSIDIYFQVMIDNELTVSPMDGRNNFTVQPGAPLTLTVSANCKTGTLTYQWYREDSNSYWEDNPINGATGATYTVDAVDRAWRYNCVVNDAYGNSENQWFYVSIDNELRAGALDNQNEFYIASGETATFTVAASCNAGILSYRWYKRFDMADGGWRSEIINGATGESYTTVPINQSESYYCQVEDQYGNARETWFYVYIDNGLTVSPVGTRTKRAEPGADVELAVEASCNDGELTYQWSRGYKQYNSEGTGWWWEYEEIDGATGSAYTAENVSARESYRCTVHDQYNGSEEIYFQIYIENEIRITNWEQDRTVPIGETAILSFAASSENGGLTYQWFRYIEYQDDNGWYSRYELIPGATNTSWTTEPVSGKRTSYYCQVCDDYGNESSVLFYVNADTGLTAEPDGAYIFQASDAPVTLKVSASSNFPDDEFTYQWYRDYNTVPGETGSTFTATDAGTYYCDVSDGSQSKRVWFYVTDGPFAQTNGESDLHPEPGEAVTLSVAAWNEENDITYQWYYTNGETIIEGATNATYTFTPERNQGLFCHVEGTGLSTDIWFWIYFDHSWYSNPNGMSRIRVIPSGGSVELKVNVTSSLDDAPTYRWYKNRTEIPGETNNTLTVSEEGMYSIQAMDRYDNTYGDTIYCLSSTPDLLNAGTKVTKPEESAYKIYRIVPGKTGIYEAEAEGYVYLYRENDWDCYKYFNSGKDTVRLEKGKTYYVVLDDYYDSFKYTLSSEEQTEFTVSMPKGMSLEIRDLYRNNNNIYVDYATSSDRNVIQISDNRMNLVKNGTATVKVTYENNEQYVYHITVTDGAMLALPEQLQTIEAEAFSGDTSAKIIKLGGNVQTVKRGAFANMGNVCLIIESSNIQFEAGAFANTTPVIICVSVEAEWYCRNNGIPYFYFR